MCVRVFVCLMTSFQIIDSVRQSMDRFLEFNFKPIFDHFPILGCYPFSRNHWIRVVNRTHTHTFVRNNTDADFYGANLISFSFLPLHWSAHANSSTTEFASHRFTLILLLFLVLCSFCCCPFGFFLFCLMHWKQWSVSFIDAWPHMYTHTHPLENASVYVPSSARLNHLYA